MPIDDALEKISIETSKPEGKKDAGLIKTPESLILRAREITGKVLGNYFTGQLIGQIPDNLTYKINPVLLNLIEKMGFDLFCLKPQKRSQTRVLNTELCNTVDENLNKEMLKLLCGEYALKTDLATLTAKENTADLYSLIPEFKNVKIALLDSNNTFKDYYRATINPYLIVMSMGLKYRPLAAIAVEKSIGKKRIEFLNEQLPGNLSVAFLERKLADAVPWTEDYVDAAQEYGITEVIPVLKEFTRVVDEYIQKWGA